MALTIDQAAQLAAQAGFTGQGLVNIVAIMGRESGYDPTAYNPNSGTGDDSVGLTQINLYGDLLPGRIAELNSILPADQQVQTADQARAMLKIPSVNLKMAYLLSNGGTDFSPWKMSADPNSFLQGTDVAAAQTAVASMSDNLPSGVAFGSRGMAAPMANDTSNSGDGSGNSSVDAAIAGFNQTLSGMPTGAPTFTSPNGQTTWNQFQQGLQQAQQIIQSIQNAPDSQSQLNSIMALQGLSTYLSALGSSLQTEGPSAQWRNWLGGLQQNLSAFQAQAAAQSSAASAYNTAQQNITNRANLALTAQQAAQPWGTSNGKTSFSAADLGMASSPLLGYLGINPNAPLVTYPGVTTYNPLVTANNIAAQQGVSGPMPAIGTNPNSQGQAGNAFSSNNPLVPPSTAPSAPNTGNAGAATATAAPFSTVINRILNTPILPPSNNLVTTPASPVPPTQTNPFANPWATAARAPMSIVMGPNVPMDSNLLLGNPGMTTPTAGAISVSGSAPTY